MENRIYEYRQAVADPEVLAQAIEMTLYAAFTLGKRHGRLSETAKVDHGGKTWETRYAYKAHMLRSSCTCGQPSPCAHAASAWMRTDLQARTVTSIELLRLKMQLTQPGPSLGHARNIPTAQQPHAEAAVSLEGLLWEVDLTRQGPLWYEVSLGIEIGGVRVDLLRLVRELIKREEKSIFALVARKPDSFIYVVQDVLTGNHIALPVGRLRKIANFIYDLERRADGGAGPARISRFDFGLADAIRANAGFSLHGADEMLAVARTLEADANPPDPAFLAQIATPLWNHQVRGLSTLAKLARHGLGAILHDYMGGGKTATILAHILHEKRSDQHRALPSLVVVTRKIYEKWQAQRAKFTPSLSLLALDGPRRRARYDEIHAHDVTLVTHEIMLADIEILNQVKWHIMAIDEGHHIRNSATQIYGAALSITADQKILASGTIIQNSLTDLWAALNFIMPGILRSFSWFKKHFIAGLDQKTLETAEGEELMRERLRILGGVLRPFLLHYTKAEVRSHLPPIEDDLVEVVPLFPAQADFYETTRAALAREVFESIQATGMARQQFSIFPQLARLRQVCCHPALVDPDTAVKSAKLAHLVGRLRVELGAGHRPVVSSSYAGMLHILQRELDGLGISTALIDGDTRNPDREQALFKSGARQVLLLSLKAAGEGIDVVEADVIFLYDPWYNPMAEEQVICRIHRPGQARPVRAIRLLCENTLEEGIYRISKRKENLIESLFTGMIESHLKIDISDVEMLLAPLKAAARRAGGPAALPGVGNGLAMTPGGH